MPRRPPKPRPRHPRGPKVADPPGGRPGRARPRRAVGVAVACGLAAAIGLAAWASRPAIIPEAPGSTAAPIGVPAATADRSAWLRRIDRLRVEDRTAEALEVGRSAFAAVPPRDRPEVLRAATLALLADVPEDQALALLRGRIEADPGDLDAQVALLRRSLARPDGADGGRPRVGRAPGGVPEALDELSRLLGGSPEHLGAREALADALLDAGRINEARSVLDAWPEDRRGDPGWLRLRSRIDLDHDDRPDRAARAIGRLLEAAPHDWRLRARLARAIERSGDAEGARRQAEQVDRLRERLDPERLGPRLATDLDRLDDPAALEDLAALCASVGLADLAAAWRLEAARLAGGRDSGSSPGAGPSGEAP